MWPVLTEQPSGAAPVTVPLARLEVDAQRAVAAVPSLVCTCWQGAAEAPFTAPRWCVGVEGFKIGEAEDGSIAQPLHLKPH